jgi:hypothetical protein
LKKKDKQASPIEAHEKDSPPNPMKGRGRPFRSKNNKKNLAANNVVQKRNVLTKKIP